MKSHRVRYTRTLRRSLHTLFGLLSLFAAATLAYSALFRPVCAPRAGPTGTGSRADRGSRIDTGRRPRTERVFFGRYQNSRSWPLAREARLPPGPSSWPADASKRARGPGCSPATGVGRPRDQGGPRQGGTHGTPRRRVYAGCYVEVRRTFSARGPLGPSLTSNSTLSPSRRLSNPSP